MRAKQFFISTLKEAPAEAELVSHRLMLRAGLIRKLGSGLYTWMPMGLRVLRKVENIVREEMNAAGAIELLMPLIHPAELWQETGRWEKYGPNMLRIKDRHERDFLFAPTRRSRAVVTRERHGDRRLLARGRPSTEGREFISASISVRGAPDGCNIIDPRARVAERVVGVGA